MEVVGGCVRNRRRVCTVSFGTSPSAERPMSLIEAEGSRANVKQEGMVSTGTDDLEAMLSRPQPELTQVSLAEKLPTPILNLIHAALAQGLKESGDVLVGESYRNRKFEIVKEG